MSVGKLSLMFDDVVGSHVLSLCDTLNCAYCGKKIDDLCVYWDMAGSAAILLHEECAQGFASHLIKDALLARQIRRGRPVDNGVSCPHETKPYVGHKRDAPAIPMRRT
jgi:hypothetical protein